MKFPDDTAIIVLDIYHRETRAYVHSKICMGTLIPQTGSGLDVFQWMNVQAHGGTALHCLSFREWTSPPLIFENLLSWVLFALLLSFC
jgi:hypothetical protein